jgi:hypothetical protein
VSTFHDMRESLCFQKVSMFLNVREGLLRHLSLCVSPKYGYPPSGGAVEGRKSTPEPVGGGQAVY